MSCDQKCHVIMFARLDKNGSNVFSMFNPFLFNLEILNPDKPTDKCIVHD